MSKIIPFLRTWGPSLLMMTLIFGFSSIPSNEMPSFGLVDWLVKKGGHATGYALLALANLRAWRQSQDGHQIRPYGLAWLLAVLYSATDEFHQSFVAGRHPTVTDVGIDAMGAAVGLLIWFLIELWQQKSGQ